MATIALTVVGSVIGGPVGAAIGSFIGNQIDQRLFAPKGVQGPRLGDLSVQLSRYGQPIPKLFGTMRVAGSVIWATDLQEQRHRSGGGKSGPKVTAYSYSASFAVLLSARKIGTIKRIWADGKLLRGSAGDWKSDISGFRVQLGDDDQPVDPLMAAAEGAAPACRGQAVVVFQNLQLADFGNRIPSLTFEVEADVGLVDVAEILAASAPADAVVVDLAETLGGYALSGDTGRAVFQAWDEALGLSIHDDGAALQVSARGEGAMHHISLDQCALNDEGRAGFQHNRQAAARRADQLVLRYYDATRDYEAGLQTVSRDGYGRTEAVLELPAQISASQALYMAEQKLTRDWAEAEQGSLNLPYRYLGTMQVGDSLRLEGWPGQWRITHIRNEKFRLRLSLVRLPVGSAVVTAPVADPGRSVGFQDSPAGATRIHLLDLPVLDGVALDQPYMWVAACGTGAGWRSAEILLSLDGGLHYEAVGSTAAPAVMGIAQTILPPASPHVFDRQSQLEVQLYHTDMVLEGISDDDMLAGRNLLMVGEELLQFGIAEDLGAGRWRLRHFLRGRRGTEYAITNHIADEKITLVEADTLLAVPLSMANVMAQADVMVIGKGSGTDIAHATHHVLARALRPPLPAHVRAKRLSDGSIELRWVRRSRAGWHWLDGMDAPLGETQERYRVAVSSDGQAVRNVETEASLWSYSAEQQAEDGVNIVDFIECSVIQLGNSLTSYPDVAKIITV